MICTPFITLRNGKRLYAHEKGKEAFCFNVTEEKHKEYMKRKGKDKQQDENSSKEG